MTTYTPPKVWTWDSSYDGFGPKAREVNLTDQAADCTCTT